MPRPKGSKNKATSTTPIPTPQEVKGQITATQQEIDELSATLKSKKATLRALTKELKKAEQLAAARKIEEDRARLLEAVKASGKSIDEIIELIK